MSFRKTLSWCLFPFTIWYGIVVGLRNRLFDIGIIKQKTVPVATIGIGNLACGGTGKTPHVEYLLNLLAEENGTALLSRGYRRKSKGFVMDKGNHDALAIGDEPAMVARKFPNVTVAVCEKRLEGIQRLLQTDNPPQLIIMDDCYQHRYVRPDINILLTEYARPYSRDKVLPFGNLRESKRGSQRADIVIVTKTPKGCSKDEQQRLAEQLHLLPHQKLFFSHIAYGGLEPLTQTAKESGIVTLRDVGEIIALTGIAHPENMVAYLARTAMVTELRFGDHHTFTSSDIALLQSAYGKRQRAEAIVVTTEKDAARLRSIPDKKALDGLPIYYLPIVMEFEDDGFDRAIMSRLEEVKR